ncbi:MAG: hypothetical protein ACRDKJ_07560 [Actinomycetota bacterium]
MSHVELYQALEPHVGVEAAKMIADVVPPASNLATKQDIERVLAEIKALEARIFRWGLAVMAPTWGAMVALAIRG